MSSCDVLVLGGGPAGAATAALAARAGARVVVVERDRFPRQKVCGEFLAPEGCRVLERLGVLDRLLARGAVWIDRFRMADPAGREVGGALPDLGPSGRSALGVSRTLLDATLLETAASSGASIRERCTARRPLLEDGRITGAFCRPAGSDREELVRARVVVAADGRRSALVRALHPRLGDPRSSPADSWFGLKVHLRGHAAALERTVELHLFDGGYLGLSHVEDDRINLALVVTVGVLRAVGGSPASLLEQRLSANPAVREIVAGRELGDDWKSVGPLRFGARRPASHGALFVGDAAGTVDPFCGEGMAHALTGAEIAHRAVMRAAEGGRLSEIDARAYARRWSRAFAGVTRRNRLLGRLLERRRLSRVVFGLVARGPSWLVPAIARSTRSGGRSLSRLLVEGGRPV